MAIPVLGLPFGSGFMIVNPSLVVSILQPLLIFPFFGPPFSKLNSITLTIAVDGII